MAYGRDRVTITIGKLDEIYGELYEKENQLKKSVALLNILDKKLQSQQMQIDELKQNNKGKQVIKAFDI